MLNLFNSAVTSSSSLSRPSLHAFSLSKNSFASWHSHHDLNNLPLWPLTFSCPPEGKVAPSSPLLWRRSGSSSSSPPSAPSLWSPDPQDPAPHLPRQAASEQPISPAHGQVEKEKVWDLVYYRSMHFPNLSLSVDPGIHASQHCIELNYCLVELQQLGQILIDFCQHLINFHCVSTWSEKSFASLS